DAAADHQIDFVQVDVVDLEALLRRRDRVVAEDAGAQRVRFEVPLARLAHPEDVFDGRRDRRELVVGSFEGGAHTPDDLGVVDSYGREVNARLRYIQFRQ